MVTASFEDWLRPDSTGLHCIPGGFHIDPYRPAKRAIITHAHSDHARPGHEAVLATAETLSFMNLRLGEGAGRKQQALAYGERLRVGDVDVMLAPAGHILGSAQVVIEYMGMRAVVTGDYKRSSDPTCQPFALVTCDLLVTEATFGLPVFRHGRAEDEISRLLNSITLFPERTHQVGVYGLGKCQRVIALLRQAGYDETIWLHGAMVGACALYEQHGVRLGPLKPVSEAGEAASRSALAGAIVLSPPSAIGDRWSRRLVDPVTAFASGWMRVRGRARQRGVTLPLVISDHVDWPELMATIEESEAGEIWVTHGREDAVVLAAQKLGRKARALALVGREDEAE